MKDRNIRKHQQNSCHTGLQHCQSRHLYHAEHGNACRQPCRISQQHAARPNRERQITVLISSHILDELSRLATHYGFIDKGTIVKEITAEELENTCRKCVKLQVTDTAVLAHILDKRGLEYEILSDTQANVYGELVVSDVALELAEQNCRMFSVQEYEESLESYYLNLVGGGKHE